MSGMTLWRIRVNKTLGTDGWSNTYVVNAANLAAAVSLGQQIATVEKAVHLNTVNFTDLEVEPVVLGAGGGTVATVGGTGSLTQGGDRLPLYCCVRVNFRPASGRPSMKYLRAGIDETNQANGVLAQGVVTLFVNNYLNPLLGMAAFVDIDGQAFTGGHVAAHVQERQLKRKRRTRPGFKRGWVPA